jgi:plasmid stabilization system protein ParE
MASIVYAPEALDDIQEILDFLGKQRDQNPKLVEKFESDYRKALNSIRDFPQAWPKVGRSVRVKMVSKRFRYGIFYRYFKKVVFIGAVIHLTRRASLWKSRFQK